MWRLSRSMTMRYGVAVLSIALATGLRVLLDPVLGDLFPFATLFLAVLLTAWYAGLGPAMTATLLGTLASVWFFLPPRHNFAVHGFENQVGLGLYVAVSLGIAALGGAMRAARRRAEADASAAALQREELRNTLASIGDAVIVTDAAGRVVSINPVAEALTGWTTGAASGRPLEAVFAIVNERTRQRVENPVARVLKEGVVVGLANSTVLIAKDGTERPIDDSAAPIRHGGGRLGGVILVFRDVTERRRAEEAHRRLAAIVESSDDAIIGKDMDGNITSWNAGAERVYGYRGSEVLGKPFSLLVPPGRAGEVEDSARRLREGERLDHFETVRRRKDGTLIDVSVSYSPIKDAGGHLAGTAVITRDVTDRKRAEEQRRRSEQELADFFDNATVGLHWAGPDGTILRVNQAELDLLGYAREEYVGRHIAEFHADEGVIGDILRRLHGGEKLHDYPARMRCKDGSVKDVLISSSVLWEGGRFVHTRCFTRDVTEQKRAEEAAWERGRQLQLVTDNAPVLIAHCDPQGRYKFVNKPYAERLGLHPRDILGKTIPEVLGDEAFAVIAPYVAAALGGRRVEFEAEVPYRDTGTQHMLCAYEPEFDDGGRVVGYVAAITNITERKRVERALSASEQRFRTLTNHAPVGIFLTDAEGNCLFVNRRWCEMAGMPPDESQGQGWARALHPEDRERVFEEWYAAARAGREFGSEYRFRTPQGKVTWVRGSAVALRDEAGDAGGFVGTVMDTTEQKTARAALEESEQRFRQLAEHITDVFWLADPRPPRLLYVSPAYETVWGRSRQSLSESPRSFLEAVHPEDRGRVADLVGRQGRGEATTQEYRVVRPDGSVRWVWDRAFPIRDAGGQVYRVAGIAEDITDRRRAEQDARFLADASANLASLVDHESTLQKVARLAVPSFADWCTVDMLDEDGTLRRLAFAHADPSKVQLARELHRRYPPDPAAPRGVWHVIRTGKSEIVSEVTDDMLVAGAKDAELLRVLRELGLKSYVGVPLSVRGRVLGVATFIAAESGRRYDAHDLAVAEDLAHRTAVAVENARLYREVREADRKKDEFLAVLGHELRNPLAPISNALHVLKSPGVSGPVVEQAREMMERQVRHMVRLVDDLLDVSRIVRGKVELRREAVELAAVVTRAAETLQPLVESEGHELSVSLPPEPVRVNGDPVRLTQVVGNLLNNAARYTERGGRIWVSAGREGGRAVIRVRDTGVGIAAEAMPRIWDMFVQADRRLKRAQGGLGIGLTLVKSLTELHGGTAEARSEGPGKGSEFIVVLPLLTSGEPEGGGGREQGPSPPAAGRRVLVVDDNVDAAESLAVLLRLRGHKTRIAYDGPTALKLAEAEPPEVAFLDIGMPGMNGYELARQFRAHPALKSVVLVALTGWGQDEDRRRTKEAGFDAHHIKPVEPEALNELLSERQG